METYEPDYLGEMHPCEGGQWMQARPHVLTVFAREWFSDGSTYQSVAVNWDGVRVGMVPFAYGHDDAQAIHAARVMLTAAGVPCAWPAVSYWRSEWEEHGTRLVTDVVRVSRRRDMFAQGKGDAHIWRRMVAGSWIDLAHPENYRP